MLDNARKMSKYGVFSSPYFPLFGLNIKIYSKSPYSVQKQENTDQNKLRIWTLFKQWEILGKYTDSVKYYHNFLLRYHVDCALVQKRSLIKKIEVKSGLSNFSE